MEWVATWLLSAYPYRDYRYCRGKQHLAMVQEGQIHGRRSPTELVRVVIQDGFERGIVERARSGGLSRPRLGTSIINGDRIRVLRVSVQDVDGVEELG